MRSMVEGADGVQRVEVVLKGGLTELEAPRHGYIVPSKSKAHKDDLPALASDLEPCALYEPPPALRATSPMNGGGSASTQKETARATGNRCRRGRVMARSNSFVPQRISRDRGWPCPDDPSQNAEGWTGHCSRHGLRILPHDDVGEGDHAKHGGGGCRSTTGEVVLKGGLMELEAPRHGYIVPSKSKAHKDDLPALASDLEPCALYEPPPALRATSPLKGGGSASAQGKMVHLHLVMPVLDTGIHA